jgi:membrane-associated protein
MIAILTPLLYTLGPWAIFLVMAVVFTETGLLVGFFLPGDSLLFLAGALVASHVIALPIWVLGAGVFVAAVAGDQLGYLIGRRFGPKVFSRPDSRFFRHENAERAQAFFARRGALAVILGRFVPVVRTFVPVVAGVGKMPHRTFTALNVVGHRRLLLRRHRLRGRPHRADHHHDRRRLDHSRRSRGAATTSGDQVQRGHRDLRRRREPAAGRPVVDPSVTLQAAGPRHRGDDRPVVLGHPAAQRRVLDQAT